MSNEAQVWADLQDVGNPQAALVLQAIARHADWETGRCWPSVKTIARMAKCSDRTAQRYIDRLATDGIIKVSPRFRDDGSQTSNGLELVGYAEWHAALRTGGEVKRPKAIPQYRDDELPGRPPSASAGRRNGAVSPPPDSLSPPPDSLSPRPRQQVSPAPRQQVSPLRTSLEHSLNTHTAGERSDVDHLIETVATPERALALSHLFRPLLAELPLIAPDPVAALGALADEAAGLLAAELDAALAVLRGERAANVKPGDIRRALTAARKATPKAAHPAAVKSENGNASPVFRVTAADPSFVEWLEAAPEKERPAIEAAGEVSASARWPRPGARLFAPVTFEMGAA
jgi:hypothetical protein